MVALRVDVGNTSHKYTADSPGAAKLLGNYLGGSDPSTPG